MNEVYLDDQKKWVFIDPQYAVIPVAGSVPLNALELQQYIASNRDFQSQSYHYERGLCKVDWPLSLLFLYVSERRKNYGLG